MFAQSLAKGSFDKIDWSDAATAGLVNNRQFRNLLKSFVDASSENGIDIKSLNDGLAEFGLRIINDKLMSEKTTGPGRYSIDLVRKVLLNEEKKIVNKIKDKDIEKKD